MKTLAELRKVTLENNSETSSTSVKVVLESVFNLMLETKKQYISASEISENIFDSEKKGRNPQKIKKDNKTVRRIMQDFRNEFPEYTLEKSILEIPVPKEKSPLGEKFILGLMRNGKGIHYTLK